MEFVNVIHHGLLLIVQKNTATTIVMIEALAVQIYSVNAFKDSQDNFASQEL